MELILYVTGIMQVTIHLDRLAKVCCQICLIPFMLAFCIVYVVWRSITSIGDAVWEGLTGFWCLITIAFDTAKTDHWPIITTASSDREAAVSNSPSGPDL